MKNLAITSIGALLALTLTSCSTTPKTGQTIELFNGTNLEGWSYVSADPKLTRDQIWTVKDGVISCPGKPLGAIYSGPSVTNFRFSVEYRWPAGSQPGNSGIFSRMTLPPKPLPQTVEVQLKHGDAGDVMGLHGRQIDVAQNRFFSLRGHPVAGDIAGVKKIADHEKAPGEWNRVEILAQGDHYQVWLNGTLVNDVRGVEMLASPIGLQCEENTVQFKNVLLTPLD